MFVYLNMLLNVNQCNHFSYGIYIFTDSWNRSIIFWSDCKAPKIPLYTSKRSGVRISSRTKVNIYFQTNIWQWYKFKPSSNKKLHFLCIFIKLHRNFKFNNFICFYMHVHCKCQKVSFILNTLDIIIISLNFLLEMVWLP